jgi:hypothetical protein
MSADHNKSPPAHTPDLDSGNGVCKVRRCFTFAANVDGQVMSTDGPDVWRAIDLRSGNGALKSETNIWSKSGDTRNAFDLKDAKNITLDAAARGIQPATPKLTEDAFFGWWKEMLPAHSLSRFSNLHLESAITAQQS